MKNTFKFLFAVAAFGLLATGCSKEATDNGIDGGEGEKSYIQLTVTSEIPGTRGSTTEQAASDAESAIDDSRPLKVWVFNSDFTLDKAASLSLTETVAGSNVFISSPIEIGAGSKYFYVFANDPASGGKITAATTGITMDAFMKTAITTANPGGALDIAVDNAFLLGTSWAQQVTAPAGGTADAPVTVTVPALGRLTAKVNLSDIVYSSKADHLQGAFSAGQYRIGSLPYKINTVGVYEGANIPVGNHGVLVISQAHEYFPTSPFPPLDLTNGGENEYNATDFLRYASWKAVNTLGDGTNGAATGKNTNSFYTNENTTKLINGVGVGTWQYFGNTSYIQIQTVYAPVAAELYSPVTLVAGQNLAGNGDFWAAEVNGVRILFNAEPEIGTAHEDIDMDTIVKYEGGKNYHKFAIFDPNESEPEKSNRVLRNHYYEFSITKFNDLGSHTDKVSPIEPVPTTTTVEIKVQVKNWDKVSSGVQVG